jgi:hypothetical protein
VASESPGSPSSSGLCYTMYRPDGTQLSSFCADSLGRGQSSPVVLPASGTHYVRVSYNYGYEGEYRLRVTLAAPPLQMETEANNSTAAANAPVLAVSGPSQQATVAGYIGLGDPGDFYSLGNLTGGTTITLGLTQPATSGLAAELAILKGTTVVATGSDPYAIPLGEDGAYYARVTAGSGTAGLQSQYLLSIDVADLLSPFVTGDTLPGEGTTISSVYDRFNLSYSEDMLAATVNSSASYDLREAGADGTFDTADDVPYTVVTRSTYSSGLTASYRVSDGPLQPGHYRFRATAALTDKVGNALDAEFSRGFFVTGVAPYVLENRANDTQATATPLSDVQPEPDGSFTFASSWGVGSNPYYVTAGDLDGDGRLDLVTANYSSSTVSVLRGNGDGSFQSGANYATGSNAIAVAVGDLNGDGRPDLVSANHSANTVSVLLQNADGTFAAKVDYAVGARPRAVRLADLNGDGVLDVVTANETGDSVSVLLGTGSGSLTGRVDYTAGDGPLGLFVADLDGDGRLDLVTANVNAHTVGVLLGNGDGTFQSVVAYSTGASTSPRDVAAADLNGDGVLDLVTANASTQFLSVLLGSGGGVFGSPAGFGSGSQDAYHLVTADLNADGKVDVALANYGGNRLNVFLGRGNGTFQTSSNYQPGGNPIGVAAGDFNGDGRMDLATANYSNHTVTVHTGNASTPLPEDPAGSGLYSSFGRGNLWSTADFDYYSFSGAAGQQLTVAVEVPGNPAASQLYYRVDRPDGSYLTDFYADSYNGWGESDPVVLPVSGTYTVYARYNYDYQGEYRLRVTLADPPIRMESENNNETGSADPPLLTMSGASRLVGTVAAYVSVGDGFDYYALGNLVPGTVVRAATRTPAAVLWIPSWRSSTAVPRYCWTRTAIPMTGRPRSRPRQRSLLCGSAPNPARGCWGNICWIWSWRTPWPRRSRPSICLPRAPPARRSSIAFRRGSPRI